MASPRKTFMRMQKKMIERDKICLPGTATNDMDRHPSGSSTLSGKFSKVISKTWFVHFVWQCLNLRSNLTFGISGKLQVFSKTLIFSTYHHFTRVQSQRVKKHLLRVVSLIMS
jgi:hypothetical protein